MSYPIPRTNESAIKCKDSSVGPEKDELENALCVRARKRLR